MAGCKARCSPDPVFVYDVCQHDPQVAICCLTLSIPWITGNLDPPNDSSNVEYFEVSIRAGCSGDPNNSAERLGTERSGHVNATINPFYLTYPRFTLRWTTTCGTDVTTFEFNQHYSPLVSQVPGGTLVTDPLWYLDGSLSVPIFTHFGVQYYVTVTMDCYTVNLNCASIDCFPDCISSTLECDGVTPAHSLLFVDIDDPGQPWDGDYNFFFDEAQYKYYLFINEGGLQIYISLGCETGVAVLRTAIYSEVREEWLRNEYSQSMVCNAVPADIQDITFTLSWNNVGVSINAECTIFSNNNGLR